MAEDIGHDDVDGHLRDCRHGRHSQVEGVVGSQSRDGLAAAVEGNGHGLHAHVVGDGQGQGGGTGLERAMDDRRQRRCVNRGRVGVEDGQAILDDGGVGGHGDLIEPDGGTDLGPRGQGREVAVDGEAGAAAVGAGGDAVGALAVTIEDQVVVGEVLVKREAGDGQHRLLRGWVVADGEVALQSRGRELRDGEFAEVGARAEEVVSDDEGAVGLVLVAQVGRATGDAAARVGAQLRCQVLVPVDGGTPAAAVGICLGGDDDVAGEGAGVEVDGSTRIEVGIGLVATAFEGFGLDVEAPPSRTAVSGLAWVE